MAETTDGYITIHALNDDGDAVEHRVSFGAADSLEEHFKVNVMAELQLLDKAARETGLRLGSRDSFMHCMAIWLLRSSYFPSDEDKDS